jgi:Zn ribbon nucleic-acid-binding protein
LKSSNWVTLAMTYTADELDAIWVEYQTQNVALCPYCNSTLELELAQDSEAGEPVISVSCPGCGRNAKNAPKDRNDSEQNSI